MSEAQAVAVETSTQAAGAEATPAAGTDWDAAANEIMGLPEGSRLAGDEGSIVALPKPQSEPEPSAEAKPEGEAERTQPAEQKPPAEEIPRDESLMPREVLQALKTLPDRRTAQALRDSWFKAKAYEAVFSTVGAARAAAELAGTFGTAEEAQGMAEQALRMANVDGVLRDGDEAASEQLMGEVFQNVGPERYAALARDMLAVWSKADLQGFDDTMREIAELRGYAKAAAPAEPLLDEYGEPRQPTDAERKRAAELDARQQAIEEREAEAKARSEAADHTKLLYAVGNPLLAEIGEMIERALPLASKGAHVRIAGEVANRLTAQAAGNAAVMAGLQRARLEGPEAVARYYLGRVRGWIPGAVRDAVTGWTKDVLALNAAKVQAKKAAAVRGKDAGDGGGMRPSGGPKAARLDYSKMDDRQILES